MAAYTCTIVAFLAAMFGASIGLVIAEIMANTKQANEQP